MPWGEAGSVEEEDRSLFLYADTSPPLDIPSRQSTIKLLSGQEWLCNGLLKELLNSVVEMVSLVEGPELWEEWEKEQRVTGERSSSKRDAREERWLWKMLDECDAQQAKEEKANTKKQNRKIEQARKRMHTGKNQPSIKHILMSMQEKRKDPRKEESSVHTQTAKLQPHRLPEAFVRIGLVLDEVSPKKLKTRESQQLVTAVGIWGPERIAGIGFVTDEVGPKKLKTGTYQQPSSLVGPTMRGEGGGGERNDLETVSVAQLSSTELATRVVPKLKQCTEGEEGVIAQTVSESNIVFFKSSLFKSSQKGGECVNTQIGSESIIVFSKSSQKGGDCVNTQTGSMSNIVSDMPRDVSEFKKCEKCAKLRSVLNACRGPNVIMVW